MKRILHLFILLLCLVVTTTSCDDEPLEGVFSETGDGSDPSIDILQNTNGSITADINGEGFEASSQAVFGALRGGVFNITGVSGEETLIISVSEVEDVGTFDLGLNSMGAGAFSIANAATSSLSNFPNGSGSITIESLDMTNLTTSGTFEFTAINTISEEITVITNGVFTDIPLINDLPTGNVENMFVTTINGEVYEPDSIQGQLLTITGFSTISINTNDNTTGQSMSLSLPPDITPGEYTFDTFPGTDSIIGQYIPNINEPAAESFSSTSSGSMLTIIAHDTTNNIIEGTFSFSALPFVNTNNLDPIEITEGSFFVVY